MLNWQATPKNVGNDKFIGPGYSAAQACVCVFVACRATVYQPRPPGLGRVIERKHPTPSGRFILRVRANEISSARCANLELRPYMICLGLKEANAMDRRLRTVGFLSAIVWVPLLTDRCAEAADSGLPGASTPNGEFTDLFGGRNLAVGNNWAIGSLKEAPFTAQPVTTSMTAISISSAADSQRIVSLYSNGGRILPSPPECSIPAMALTTTSGFKATRRQATEPASITTCRVRISACILGVSIASAMFATTFQASVQAGQLAISRHPWGNGILAGLSAGAQESNSGSMTINRSM